MPPDSRRLEVVVDGLPLFGGSQLAVDTTLVCSLHRDGSPHNGAADTDSVIFPRARRAQRVEIPRVGGTWQSRAPGRIGFGCGWQVVCGVVLIHLSVGEGKGSTRTASPAEKGRAGLEDEVGSHPLLCHCEGSRNMSLEPQVRAWFGRRHSSQLGGACGSTATPGWLRESFS